MAVTPITADAFLERFPTFEGQDDLIEFLIPEAQRLVQDSWNAADQITGQMYLVAHMVVMEGQADSLPVVSESLGPISTSYAFDPKAHPYTRTEYGRRFLEIRGRNTAGGAGVVVVGGVYPGV